MTTTLTGPGGTIEVDNDVGNPLPVVLTGPPAVIEGSVALDAATLAALETIGLDAPTLAALEIIGLSNLPGDYPDAAVLAKVEAVRLLLAGTLAVAVSNFPASQPVSGPLTDGQLRASPPAVHTDYLLDSVEAVDSGEREFTHVVATVTASGDTTIHTPAAGKKVQLRWIYAINDPVSATAPLIKVLLGGVELYRVWALSKRQRYTGPTDGALVVNLSAAGSVAVTAILQEIT